MRISKLLKIIRDLNVDSVLITSEANIRYFTNLPSGGGMYLLASPNEVTVLIPVLEYWRVSDALKGVTIVPYSRYELPGAEVRPETTNVFEWIANYLLSKGVRRLGVDADPHASRVGKVFEKLERRVEAINIFEEVSNLRSIKEPEEIEAITKALNITENAFERVLSEIKAGMSEYEIAALIDGGMRSLGAEGYAFETIVASGPNAAYPHTLPSSRRVSEGDVIIIDFGARYGGYCADVTRTVVLGNVDDEVKKCLTAVKEAMDEAIKSIRPGVKASEIDLRARRILRKYGLDKYFIHGLGHGVGVEVHESPTLSPSSKDVLRPGMVVTIEPGVYIHGKLGVRIENMVEVVEGGAKVLNRTDVTAFL